MRRILNALLYVPWALGWAVGLVVFVVVALALAVHAGYVAGRRKQ